jgi:hypothetical protein
MKQRVDPNDWRTWEGSHEKLYEALRELGLERTVWKYGGDKLKDPYCLLYPNQPENAAVLRLPFARLKKTQDHPIHLASTYQGWRQDVYERLEPYLSNPTGSGSHSRHTTDSWEEVLRILLSLQDTPLPPPDFPTEFKPEFVGKRMMSRSGGETEMKDLHSRVQRQLGSHLEGLGFEVVGDGVIDVAIVENNKPTTLFEIKTGIETTDIYEAVGQLMYHSAAWEHEITRVFVVPGTPKSGVMERLEKLGIRVLRYEERKSGTISFEGLESVLDSKGDNNGSAS